MEQINTLSNQVKSILTSQASTLETFEALNERFFHDWGFHAEDRADNIESVSAAEVLTSRRGTCAGLTIIYLLVARRLELPVGAVATPLHLFIRYDDGRTRMNVELLEGGRAYDDAWYAQRYGIPERAVVRGIYLRTLDDQEVLGFVYSNLGVYYSKIGDHAGAQRMYRAALERAPRLPGVWYNLATDLLAQGLGRESVKYFSHSLRLYPADPQTLNNRGLAYCREGKLLKARRDFTDALAIEPTFQLAARNLADLRCDAKDQESR